MEFIKRRIVAILMIVLAFTWLLLAWFVYTTRERSDYEKIIDDIFLEEINRFNKEAERKGVNEEGRIGVDPKLVSMDKDPKT